jgi:hypothetical protein
MKLLLIFTLVILLCSCSSSGVVQTGEDTYIISKKSAGGGFVTGSGAKTELYQEANKFCAKNGRFVETVKATSIDGIPLVRIAGAELEFKCVVAKE